MIEIENIDDVNICEFRSLRDKNLRANYSIIVESEPVVKKLLMSQCKVHKILSTPTFIHENKELIAAKNPKILLCNKHILKQIVGFNLHHGVLALASRPKEVNLCELGKKIVILNGITSPENVGSIVRNCAAFGVNSLIVDSKSSSPYLRRSIRVSMGNIFSLNIHFSSNLVKTINLLKRDGISIYGAANIDMATSIESFQFSPRATFIIGSEGHGIEKDILDICDKIIKIPICSHVAHLNAASASSILLYKFSNLN